MWPLYDQNKQRGLPSPMPSDITAAISDLVSALSAAAWVLSFIN